MLTELKLLHAYIGGLIEEAESGGLTLGHFSQRGDEGDLSVALTWCRNRAESVFCDHEYRRIASGEYECRTCGQITEERDDV
jgi:hypothetical protein